MIRAYEKEPEAQLVLRLEIQLVLRGIRQSSPSV